MNTLKELQNKIIKIISDNLSLFKYFEHIYLFGSVIKNCSYSNDIDLLLIYSEFRDDIVCKSILISSVFEREMLLPVDLTILSEKELEETQFLEKIHHYLVLK